MREGEKGEDFNYKLILNPGRKTTAKLDVGKRLTQIKFKQIAYVMREMKETKGCLKKRMAHEDPDYQLLFMFSFRSPTARMIALHQRMRQRGQKKMKIKILRPSILV